MLCFIYFGEEWKNFREFWRNADLHFPELWNTVSYFCEFWSTLYN